LITFFGDVMAMTSLNVIKPPSTSSSSCMKIQGGHPMPMISSSKRLQYQRVEVGLLNWKDVYQCSSANSSIRSKHFALHITHFFY